MLARRGAFALAPVITGALLWLLSGCESGTSILVIVDGDLIPAVDANQIVIQTFDSGAMYSSTPSDFTSAEGLPSSLRIWAGERISQSVDVHVEGLLGEATTVSADRICDFVEGEQRVYRICLMRRCIGSDTSECRSGFCDGGDADADADVDGDIDGDTDIDGDVDGDVDGDTDGDTDIDGDVDGDIDEEVGPFCGDGICNGDETISSCSEDCPPSCGDGICNGEETSSSCSEDCPPSCPNGTCDEACSACPADCSPCCGDGECTAGESCSTCAGDCARSELCNGLDDDCDTQIDEGYDLGLACDGDDSDACLEGEIVCTAGGGARCNDDTWGNDEICDNGDDDDCDGAIDGDDDDCIPGDLCATAELIADPGLYDGSTGPLEDDYHGSCHDRGAHDYVARIVLDETSSLRASAGGSTFDTVLYLRDDGCRYGDELACDDDGGVEYDARLDLFALPAGEYFLFLDGFESGENGHYDLELEWAPVGCGNGFLELGEACDDGNEVGGDRCSAGCDASGAYALLFDGSQDSAKITDVSDLMLDGTFTLEAWYRYDGGVVDDWHPMVTQGWDSSNYWIGVESGELVGGYYNGSDVLLLSATTPTDAGWHHAAVTYDGALLELWLDGIPVDSVSSAVPPAPDDGPLFIGSGRYEGAEYSFYGAVDEVRVSSAPQYTDPFSPLRRLSVDSDTIVLLHLDEGSGVVTRAAPPSDRVGLVNNATWIAE